MLIETLPDYPAFKQLARALWHEGTARGAAVLVGAGFSTFAERAALDTPEPPLWQDFAHSMALELYSADTNQARLDPLRLAEEYRIYFGQAALDEFIRTRIRDPAWRPGPLHDALLKMEWSDVLTTNWDTLLERAADKITARYYHRVLCTADLAHAAAPRIVKLHGSIGTTEHFVIAEEDYRTYAAKYAAFVNLARQIFIENELCLVGFSGDDPNFLQWSGWIRDNLGGNSRRIYLVGALDLSPARRKFLEARNIAPIDLGPILQNGPAADRHGEAMRLFLESLEAAKPIPRHYWQPTLRSGHPVLQPLLDDRLHARQNFAYTAEQLDKATGLWRMDRENYPGWLICPAETRRRLAYGTDFSNVRKDVVEAMPAERRDAFIYELSWRYRTSFSRIDSRHVRMFEDFATNLSDSVSEQHRCEVAVLLLHRARRAGDEEAFGRWAEFIEAQCQPGTDFHAEVAYQKALNFRDRLDFFAAAEQASAINGADPIWSVRRAALLADFGEFQAAREIIVSTANDLKQRQSKDRSSLWLRSRRAWVEWFARSFGPHPIGGTDESQWSSEFRDSLCYPPMECDVIVAQVAEEMRIRREDSRPTTPLFPAGHYRSTGTTDRIRSSTAATPLESLETVMETAGMPMRLEHRSLVWSVAREAVELAFEPSSRRYLFCLRVASGRDDTLFGRYFGRVAIAQLSDEIISGLTQSVWGALVYWRKRFTDNSAELPNRFEIGKINVLISALARLTIRQESSGAKASLDLANDLARDTLSRDFWLWDSLSDLVGYSVEAIPPAERSHIALQMLNFPFASQRAVSARWPNPTEKLWETKPDRSENETGWGRCIAHLLEHAAAGKPQRQEAVTRLVYLSEKGILTSAESEAFGGALWSETDGAGGGLPANTDLLAWVFTLLPAPSGVDKIRLVEKHLFEVDILGILTLPDLLDSRDLKDRSSRLDAIARTAEGPLRPTPAQAVRMFDAIVRWRSSSLARSDSDRLVMSLDVCHYHFRRSVGEILRVVATPCLQLEDLTLDRADDLFRFLREVPGSSAAAALLHFLASADELQERVIAAIRWAILARDEIEVYGGVMAVQDWAKRAGAGDLPQLPRQLMESVLSTFESCRENGMVHVIAGVNQLLGANVFTADDRARMLRVLEELYDRKDYSKIDLDSQEAVSVSLIRAECVRLARALTAAGEGGPGCSKWLAVAEIDPLPEVRYA